MAHRAASNMKKKLLKNKGQTLIEALIALTAIILIMTGTTVAVITSLNNASQIKTETRVDKVAQQGMEYIRNQIVTNANAGAQSNFDLYTAMNGTVCLSPTFALSTVINGTCSAAVFIDGKYRRMVTFTPAQCEGSGFTNGLKVRVDVSWNDSKCQQSTVLCHTQEVTSCFINPAKVTVPTMAQGV